MNNLESQSFLLEPVCKRNELVMKKLGSQSFVFEQNWKSDVLVMKSWGSQSFDLYCFGSQEFW